MRLNINFLKKWNTSYIYIILIIGVSIMLLAGTPEEKKDTDIQSEKKDYISGVTEEKRLEEILSYISGVGDVSVMVTYYSSAEKSLAYEKKIDIKGDSLNGFGGESSDEKAVLADGEPVVIQEISPEVRGVVVVAEGAENPTVNQNITKAVSTALGVAFHKICVLSKSVR